MSDEILRHFRQFHHDLHEKQRQAEERGREEERMRFMMEELIRTPLCVPSVAGWRMVNAQSEETWARALGPPAPSDRAALWLHTLRWLLDAAPRRRCLQCGSRAKHTDAFEREFCSDACIDNYFLRAV